MLWQNLEASVLPPGFPRQPSALATVKVNGSELLAVVGGAPGTEQSSSPSTGSGELAELCVGRGGVTPTDLWARSLQGVSFDGDATAPSSPQKRSAPSELSDPSSAFQRTVLAFPPKPRTGFSLTPLGNDGQRFLLFGGHSGQSGKHGHCLADTHLLEIVPTQEREKPATSSSSSSASESEDIFFAEDYKVKLKGCTTCSMSAAAPMLSRGPTQRNDDSDGPDTSHSSSDSEFDSAKSPGKRAEAFEKTLRETVTRLGWTTKVKMKRKDCSPTKSKSATTVDHIADNAARWRLPQRQDGQLASPRVGHAAVFQPPLRDGACPSVLIHGGLDDGGVPLGDLYEVRVVESEEQPFKTEWHCLDRGVCSLRCTSDRVCSMWSGDAPAPWDQEQTPRPRACHSAVLSRSDAQRCLVIFGGLSLGLSGEARALGDTWTLGEGVTQAGWKRPVVTGGAPARRWGHGCCVTPGGKMLVCGGMDGSGKALSDCWALHLEEMRWEQVETLRLQNMIRAPLIPASSFGASNEDVRSQPPEFGRCTATWSFSLGAAVVWCGQGFWVCKAPERRSCSVSPQRLRSKGEQKPGGAEKQKQWWEQQRVRIGAEEVGPNSVLSFSDLPDVLPMGVADLPDVVPPARHSRWPQPMPSMQRVQSEPRLHDSWLPAPSLMRCTGSQGSLLESKSMMHGQMLAERPPLEAPVQRHAKHAQHRFEVLAPL